MRTTISLLIACLAASCSGRAAPSEKASPVTLTRSDSGRTVELHAGQGVIIELIGKPTTGFDWLVEDAPEALGKAAESWTGAAEKEGSGAVKRIEWQRVPAGTHVIRLGYKRRAEGQPPLESFTVTLRVSAR
jgi:predicted secreted protein